MTTENDQNLIEFFREMKNKDQLVPVPEVDYLKINNKRIRKKRNLIAVAASIALLVSFIWVFARPEEPTQEKSITEIEQNIESMMSWQSATGDLIEK